MTKHKAIPHVSVNYACNGSSKKINELGMRAMQERAFEKRGEQYLLIKSPPASGKSRALMFIALDKLHNQGIRQAIIVVPEKSIGASFHDELLTQFGFWADWQVVPKWNLCDAPGEDGGKVNSVQAFLKSGDQVLVCTHATFRFAVDRFGVEAFDGRLIAVDEFHHVSANPDNKLGAHLGAFIERDKAHIVAMTGSYFRGDAVAVLNPQDEARFETVTYTYYEQLNGYEYLKKLDIGYYFYSGAYSDEILNVLNPNEKTIIHIPNVNSRESTKDKIKEVEHIIEEMGEWVGTDPDTGFHLVKTAEGRTLRIADLVDDESKRDKVTAALKRPETNDDRDHVDIIIALGMAKEGFDWIWCEHALTVGYRASLTEIIQIIGRTTRDAEGKTRARFTNLIAEPDATEEAVTDAVNDTLKAIAASLLMEQVLAPRFNFTPKNKQSGPVEGYDYGENGYDPEKNNVGFNQQTGQFQIEIKGLTEPKSEDARRICDEDLNEVIASFVQDKPALEKGLFDSETVPEELTQVRMGKIIKDKYPELDEEDQEAVRQHAIAALNLTQKAKEIVNASGDDLKGGNTALIDGVRKFAMDVRDLDIDMIDSINPFSEAYAILAKSMSEESLKQVASVIAAKRVNLTPDEARDLAKRALKFKQERGRLDQIRKQEECRSLLVELDYQGLLGNSFEVKEPEPEALDDDELLSQLGVHTPHEGDVTYLKHVKPREEVRAAEEIASRTPCKDFETFKPIFEAVQKELESGIRKTQPFKDFAEIRGSDLFILSGQKVYVAEVGEMFINEYDRKDSRLRVIYDNGTESDILLRSLQRALNKDETGRRIIETVPGSSAGPLFSGISSEEDLASGTIYVLRSKSDHPVISKSRDVVHKIGVTSGSVERRIANAKLDPTFLMADVEVVATYELFNINRSKLENLIHKFFDGARLDIQINDRFGHPVVPREWFLIPLFVIDEVVEKIKDGTISKYAYDMESASLVQRRKTK